MFKYNKDYFFEVEPNILENKNLREPQIQAYYHAYEHFQYKKKDTHAVIILPTGVGKTGVMALLPYAQFIGRILRVIPPNEVGKSSDNIGQIIAHRNLYLDKLWDNYKIEIQESEIIKQLIEDDKISSKEGENSDEVGKDGYEESKGRLGDASENGEGRLSIDPYLKTELIKKNNEERIERENKIKELQKLLNINRE